MRTRSLALVTLSIGGVLLAVALTVTLATPPGRNRRHVEGSEAQLSSEEAKRESGGTKGGDSGGSSLGPGGKTYGPVVSELSKLHQERVGAFTKLVEIRQRKFEEERCSLEDVVQAKLKLSEARLDQLADLPDQQLEQKLDILYQKLDVLGEMIRSYVNLEEAAKKRSEDQLVQATGERLKTEIRLQRVRREVSRLVKSIPEKIRPLIPALRQGLKERPLPGANYHK